MEEQLINSKGYKSLIKAVKIDCERGENCFNENGCDKHGNKKCFHRYCKKFKWVIDRAKHYAEKTGLSITEILNSWEEQRDYGYMNYYQDARQPLIEKGRVRIFDTIKECKESFEGKGFRCPKCGNESKNHMICDSKDCDWKAYGLFGTMGKGITVFIKENMALVEIFMPVAWGQEEKITKKGEN